MADQLYGKPGITVQNAIANLLPVPAAAEGGGCKSPDYLALKSPH